MKHWYLQTWFICLLFSLWILVIPGILGIILLFFHYNALREERTKYEKERKKYETIEDADSYAKEEKNKCARLMEDTKKKTDNMQTLAQQKVNELNVELEKLKAEKENLKTEITELRKESIVAASDVYIDDSCTSEEVKNKLSLLKIKQDELIKTGKALDILKPCTENKKALDKITKQILRAFNAETANILSSVSLKNVDTQRNKLQKAFETLNKLYAPDDVQIDAKLLEIKLEELYLLYNFALKKDLEREEQKAIREQMVEEERVRREIEREKEKIEKEESQFKNEISKLMKYLQKADQIEKQLYIDKIKELEEKLKLLEKDKENVLEREKNTRAGYVYIISNIGSFGEDVYKIGMTRRLEPMDRIKELGDASVPFEFDVHAMIFSQDAPALETILHQTFRKYEVNKVNPRKEFFKVPLDEIETIVKENHNATVTFTKVAEAAQYRETLRLQALGSPI